MDPANPKVRYGVRPQHRNQVKFRWKDKAPSQWSFFCPLCRATRTAKGKLRPTAKHFVQVGLTSLVFTLATWTWLEWRGIVSFVPAWIAFEVFFRSRQRIALVCPHCGFDPYLYLTDIQRARSEIETHWRKKFSEKGIPFPEKDKPETLAKSDPARSETDASLTPPEPRSRA